MRSRYAGRVFAAAGIFNVVVGASLLLAPGVTAALLGLAWPQGRLFMDMAAWLILVLGLGYCLTARNPERNRDLMLIGGLGKLFVLPLMLTAWRHGEIGPPGVIAGAGDFVFALLFFDVLRRMRAPRA